MDRPRGVSQAIVVLWLTIILNVICEIVNVSLGDISVIEFLLGLVISAVLCIIPYKLSKGSDAARQCFIALFILGVLANLIILSGIYLDYIDLDLTRVDVALTIVAFPANLFILYRLLQHDAVMWFSEQEQNIKDSGMEAYYPAILRRYLSTLIDGCLILSLLLIIPYFTESKENTLYFRLIAAAIILFGYEPLFTSKFCTLGQKIMGIRIRTTGNYQRLNYPAALLRVIIKWVLGFISLFSIIVSKERRALHDFASGSIVLSSSWSEDNQQAHIGLRSSV